MNNDIKLQINIHINKQFGGHDHKPNLSYLHTHFLQSPYQ